MEAQEMRVQIGRFLRIVWLKLRDVQTDLSMTKQLWLNFHSIWFLSRDFAQKRGNAYAVKTCLFFFVSTLYVDKKTLICMFFYYFSFTYHVEFFIITILSNVTVDWNFIHFYQCFRIDFGTDGIGQK